MVNSSTSKTTYNGFDNLGNLTSSTQTTGSSYDFSYSYNLANALTSVTYPSQRAVSYTYDSLGRIATVNGAAAGGSNTPYASGISYASHGPIAQVTLGGTLLEKRSYSPDRLQPTSVSFGTSTSPTAYLGLNFYYCRSSQVLSCSNNNGNMISQAINPLGVTQAYSYSDGFNRLTSATETLSSNTIWSQAYVYDDYGNRALLGTSSDPSQGMDLILRPVATSTSSVPFDNHNHWTAAGYDSQGNLTNADAGAGNTFQTTYDGENRQTSVTATVGGTAATTQYVYDGDGKRVQKVAGGLTRTYVYDAAGQLAAEYGAANPDSGTQYLSTDHMGSTRAVATVVNGVVTQVSKSDYLPFGQEIPTTWGSRSGYQPDASETMKFTGKEGDAETGLDYFGARYMSAVQGRFMTPDWNVRPEPVPYSDLSNPQSLNLYVYAGNNPLNAIDEDGHLWGWVEKLGNALAGNGWRTNAEVLHEKAEWDRRFLVNIREFNKDQVSKLSDQQVVDLMTAVQNNDSSFISEGTRFVITVVAAAVVQKAPVPGLSGKEAAKDVPSWAKGERPNAGEDGKAFAKRLMDQKYGDGKWLIELVRVKNLIKFGNGETGRFKIHRVRLSSPRHPRNDLRRHSSWARWCIYCGIAIPLGETSTTRS